ncbi:MAG: bifunctional hydroxymethylpyrimidine kinase/phosphomethylpyrimidine kinase [Fusobacterium sp.]|nr:bifunctional hydroxymethylpyrimidine kinase/phosphomethylpyrimidine kinase [Fusobacterium sp.]
MKKVLSIAGSDSSGGAGIQADIKTITMHGVYAMTAITALTAQNTMGVSAILETDPEFLAKQLDSVFEDIYPDAIKIGMLSSSELIKVIAEKLKFYKAKKIVIDPVMLATSGSNLIKTEAISTMIDCLFPIADLITPNIPEAEILSDMKINTKKDMEKAAEKIGNLYNVAVLLKGGHSINDANDLLYKNNKFIWFEGRKIENHNTHGTGCTLSSAIASNLAKDFDLETSIKKSKEYISGALAAMLNLGSGNGPLKHTFNLSDE